LDETMVCACGPEKSGCGTNGFDAKARATRPSRGLKACGGMCSAASVFVLVSRPCSLTVSIVVAC
jgi:hypothetical protein